MEKPPKPDFRLPSLAALRSAPKPPLVGSRGLRGRLTPRRELKPMYSPKRCLSSRSQGGSPCSGARKNCSGCLPEAPKRVNSARMDQIQHVLQQLDSLETGQLKAELLHTHLATRQETRSVSASRLDEIRQQVAETNRFRYLQFKQDVLTQEGVEKILRSRRFK